jgi:Ca-activated chloride channel family protein
VRRPAEAWRFVRLGLVLLGVAGFVLALARPQWGVVREKVEREGVDVVLVLDSSGSMATEDVAPSRFFLARAALTSLVSRLEGDRIGLLAFEGEAYPLVSPGRRRWVFLETRAGRRPGAWRRWAGR